MDIPDKIDPENETQKVKEMREENQGPENKDKEEPKRGKCGCLII